MSNMIAPQMFAAKRNLTTTRHRPSPSFQPVADSIRFLGLSQPAKTNEPKPGEPKKPNYQTPQANSWAMGFLTLLNDYLVFNGVPVLRSIPLVNRIPGMQGFTGIEQVDLPEEDLMRLKKAINPDTIAFVGPNHPEFFHDWVIDKKLSSIAAPEIACWADAGIVNGNAVGRRFMLANNIIANNGKERAKEDSINAALKGQGVLLHPEGRVWWHGDKVHPLFPGIVDMAMEAAKRPEGGKKPVYVVPVSWKLEFNSDVSQGLHQDMADIEQKLHLNSPPKLSVGQRFFRLQEAMLAHQEKQFGYPAVLKALYKEKPYFQRQQGFQEFLIYQLQKRYGRPEGLTPGAKHLNLERAIARKTRENPEQVSKEDRAALKELYRLEGFTPELYNRPYLTQEQLYENIKRSMQSFFGGLKTTIPKPPGGRVAHIRVAEPIQVREHVRPDMTLEEQKRVSETLQKQVHTALQGKLDEVNEEIAPSVRKYQVENEFYTPHPLLIKARL